MRGGLSLNGHHSDPENGSEDGESGAMGSPIGVGACRSVSHVPRPPRWTMRPNVARRVDTVGRWNDCNTDWHHSIRRSKPWRCTLVRACLPAYSSVEVTKLLSQAQCNLAHCTSHGADNVIHRTSERHSVSCISRTLRLGATRLPP